MSSLDKLEVLEDFFTQPVWFLEFGEGRRLVGITVKVEPQGYLAVLKCISPEGPQVAFVGSSSLDGVRRKLRDAAHRGEIRWRDDKYKLDKNHKVR